MDPSALGAELMKNPQFMEMFQKAMGDSQIPQEGDPAREKWLRDMQAKLKQQTKEDAKKQLETPQTDEQGTWMYIVPEPGFCIKCHLSGGTKVFVNLCQHERIAEPIPMPEEEQEDEDAIKFKIPLSCGQARPEVDKKGKSCKAYDVIVNPNTIKRCSEDSEFRRFVAALSMTWIKQKSEPQLNADEFTNVNIKCKGTPDPQRIRLSTNTKPQNALNGEINLPAGKDAPSAPLQQGGGKKKLVEEIDPTATVPPSASAAPVIQQNAPTHTMDTAGVYDWSPHGAAAAAKSPYVRETVPERFILHVTLPKVNTIREVDVQVKSKRVSFYFVDEISAAEDEGRLPRSFYEITVSFPVDEDPLVAKFTRATKTLLLHLKVSLPMNNQIAASRDAVEEEEEAARLAEEESNKRIEAHRERMSRLQKEEADVMKQRKEWLDNMNAVAEGALPPALTQEVDSMSKEQQQTMLMRVENKILKGDSIDELIKRLPQEAVDGLSRYLRNKLGLEIPASLQKKPTPNKEEEAKSVWQKQLEDEKNADTVEYNFAKKASRLFGVEMQNRYLFALDH